MRRRMKMAVTVGVFVLVTVIGGGPSTAAADDGRRIVMVLNGMLGPVQTALSLIPEVQVLHVLSFINALGVQLDLDILDTLVQTLLDIPGVLAVSYDPLGSLTLLDPISSVTAPSPEDYDWGLEQILVPEVHDDGWQGSGVTVAIMDTGIDRFHPEFKNEQGLTRITGGFNAVVNEGGGCNGGANGGAYDDNHGHGTHVAGIIAAAVNDQGIVGAAPKVKIKAVKVLDKDAHGYLSDFICGLQWVYNQNVRLVNMSVGFWNDKIALQQAIQKLKEQKGAIMVAAAGNHSSSSDPSCVSGVEGGGVDDGGGDGGEQESVSCDPSSVDVMYPAAYQQWVIGVAATKYNNTDPLNLTQTEITYYTKYGPEITVVASGGEKNGKPPKQIVSTRLNGGYGKGSGTSQSTACVTGAIALALNKKPNLTFEEARNTLQATAWDLVDYWGQLQNLKLINAQEFVESLP
jgi:subtilisin family serine protease